MVQESAQSYVFCWIQGKWRGPYLLEQVRQWQAQGRIPADVRMVPATSFQKSPSPMPPSATGRATAIGKPVPSTPPPLPQQRPLGAGGAPPLPPMAATQAAVRPSGAAQGVPIGTGAARPTGPMPAPSPPSLPATASPKSNPFGDPYLIVAILGAVGVVLLLAALVWMSARPRETASRGPRATPGGIGPPPPHEAPSGGLPSDQSPPKPDQIQLPGLPPDDLPEAPAEQPETIEKWLTEMLRRQAEKQPPEGPRPGHQSNPSSRIEDHMEIIQRACVVIVTSRLDGTRLGSGFFVRTPSGRPVVVTNFHVVNGAIDIGVKLYSGQMYRVTRCALEPRADLAFLEVQGLANPPATLGLRSAPLRLAEEVYVYGAPKGLEKTITRGILSGVRTTSELMTLPGLAGFLQNYDDITWVQTDAPINEGNSGGPILDRAGQVVAVATWKVLPHHAEGFKFGVSATEVQHRLQRMQLVPLAQAGLGESVLIAQQIAEAVRNTFVGWTLVRITWLAVSQDMDNTLEFMHPFALPIHESPPLAQAQENIEIAVAFVPALQACANELASVNWQGTDPLVGQAAALIVAGINQTAQVYAQLGILNDMYLRTQNPALVTRMRTIISRHQSQCKSIDRELDKIRIALGNKYGIQFP